MDPGHGHIVLVENGLDRAFGDTSPAVDAFIGMYVDHFGILVKAITWANFQASLDATQVEVAEQLGVDEGPSVGVLPPCERWSLDDSLLATNDQR